MIIFLGGDNNFAIVQHITKLRQQYARKYQDALDEVMVDISTDGYAGLEQSLLALPMFFSHRLVVVTGIAGLKDEISKLEVLFSKTPETTVAVIDGRGLDKRTKLYKLLSDLKHSKIFTAHNPQDRIAWMRTEAKRHGAELSASDAQLLVGRVGDDEWLIANEIAKLALASPKITAEIIGEHTSKNVHDSVFDLIEMIGRGNMIGAVESYQQLSASGANDQQLISTLMWHYRVLTLAMEGADEAELKACGIKSYSIQKAQPVARHLTSTDLERSYDALLDTDIAIKTGEKKAHQAMLDLVIQLSDGS